jgi:hypothetical protein
MVIARAPDLVAAVLAMALLSMLVGIGSAAGMTARGWQFRALLRWVRKRIGAPIGP